MFHIFSRNGKKRRIHLCFGLLHYVYTLCVVCVCVFFSVVESRKCKTAHHAPRSTRVRENFFQLIAVAFHLNSLLLPVQTHARCASLCLFVMLSRYSLEMTTREKRTSMETVKMETKQEKETKKKQKVSENNYLGKKEDRSLGSMLNLYEMKSSRLNCNVRKICFKCTWKQIYD